MVMIVKCVEVEKKKHLAKKMMKHSKNVTKTWL